MIVAKSRADWDGLGWLARNGDALVERGKQLASRGFAHGEVLLRNIADLEAQRTQRDLEASRRTAQRVGEAVGVAFDVGKQALGREGRAQIEQGRLQTAGSAAGRSLIADRFDINQRNTARASASGAQRRPEAVDIYVGGGGDFHYRTVASYADQKRGQHPERDVLYYGWDSPKRVEAVVDIYGRAGIPVNIVGHSWGASRAAHVVEHASTPIAYLATIDPVGRFENMGHKKPKSLGWWDNVTGVTTDEDKDRTDRIASVGGAPSTLPVGRADRNIVMRAHHGDFAEMMRRGGVEARLYRRGAK